MNNFANFKKVLNSMLIVSNEYTLFGIDNIDEYYVVFNFDDIYQGDCVGIDVDHTVKVITINVNEKGYMRTGKENEDEN